MYVRRHDLRKIRNALYPEALEDERHGLYDDCVVVRQGRISNVPHKDRDRDRRVEILVAPRGHADEHLIGVDVSLLGGFLIRFGLGHAQHSPKISDLSHLAEMDLVPVRIKGAEYA